MKRYSIELSGTITRDIIWREADAESEAEVRAICAQEMPTYRVRSVIEVSSGNSDTTTPASADGSADEPTT